MAKVRIDEITPEIKAIVLDDPATLNSMSFGLVGDLLDVLQELKEDNGCNVVILTGEGRGFCSGMNLENVGMPPGCENLPMSRIAMRSIEFMSGLVPAMRALHQPIIAAINGPTYGGGLCMSLGADIRLAAESAVFCFAGVHHGLTGTELGISYLLPRAIGTAYASEMLLTGRKYTASDAKEMGLVSRVYSDGDLMNHAIEMAHEINEYSTHGIHMTKQVLWSNMETNSLSAAIDLEDRNQMLVRMTTQNFEEAMKARAEGRKPVFDD